LNATTCVGVVSVHRTCLYSKELVMHEHICCCRRRLFYEALTRHWHWHIMIMIGNLLLRSLMIGSLDIYLILLL